MKKIITLLVITSSLWSFNLFAQKDNQTNERLTFKVYATGINTKEEAAKVEQKFKEVKGIVETSFKYKEGGITTLFIITAENQLSKETTKEEDAAKAQVFTGISEATFKDKLLQWGYDIYEVKRVTTGTK